MADECCAGHHRTIGRGAYPRRTRAVRGPSQRLRWARATSTTNRQGGQGRNGDPVVSCGRVVLPAGEHGHPDVRRIAVDPAPPARRIELRDAAGHGRTAATPDTAIPAEGPGTHGRPDGPAGVDRRPGLRHHLSRQALGAAVAGQRRTAARADRPVGRAAARQVAAVVGDESRGRPEQEPPRPLHEIAPSADQRHDRARDRPRHRRSHSASGAVPRRHLDPGARPRQYPAVGGRARRLGDGPGLTNAGRRVSDRRNGNEFGATHRRRSPGLRRRAHVGARHRAQ